MVEIVGSILEGLFHLTEMIQIPSYALAILLLTIILKIVLYPTAIKQQKASKTMQQIQPKIKAIEKKYGNNPQKKQEMMMNLYKEEKFSPFSSCLPLLIQMPILLILFYGLRNFVPANPQFYTFFLDYKFARTGSHHRFAAALRFADFCAAVFVDGQSERQNPAYAVVYHAGDVFVFRA